MERAKPERALALLLLSALVDRIQIVLTGLLVSKAVLGAVRVLCKVGEFFGEHQQFVEVGEGGHRRECVGASTTMGGPRSLASP